MTVSRQQLRQLELLNICPKKFRKHFLKKIPTSCVKALCECVHNLIIGNLPIKSQQKKCLQKHKTTLRKIASKKGSLFSKKKLIVQKGDGFLSILLPAAITAISSIINGAR